MRVLVWEKKYRPLFSLDFIGVLRLASIGGKKGELRIRVDEKLLGDIVREAARALMRVSIIPGKDIEEDLFWKKRNLAPKR